MPADIIPAVRDAVENDRPLLLDTEAKRVSLSPPDARAGQTRVSGLLLHGTNEIFLAVPEKNDVRFFSFEETNIDAPIRRDPALLQAVFGSDPARRREALDAITAMSAELTLENGRILASPDAPQQTLEDDDGMRL